MKKIFNILVITLLAMSLVGCSKDSINNETKGDNYYPVTVGTYAVDDGVNWMDKNLIVNTEPQRVVCNSQGIAELMIRLGLKDKIVGVAAIYGNPEEDIVDDFSKLNIISNNYASKEIVLSVNPDLVIGRGDLFNNSDYGIGTVGSYDEMGIDTYIAHTGKANATYKDLIADIENLGIIFNVQDRASLLVKEYTNKINSLKQNFNSKNMKMAFIATVENGMPVISNPSTWSLQNEALSFIGLQNIFDGFKGTNISIENLIEENPDILIFFDYAGGPNVEEMANDLYNNASLQNVSAIKNRSIYSLDFNKMFGGTCDIYVEVERFAKEVY